MVEIVHELIAIPASTPHAEPIIIPRVGRPWKIADLYKLADDERRFELVRGNLIMMSPASPVQGRFAERLSRVLGQYVEDNDLGEVYVSEPGFELRPDPDPTVRAPDVAFVAKARIPPPEQQAGFWPLAPDLAVEIIAPSGTAEMIQEKVQDYLGAGTRLVWLVYPRTKTIIVYHSASQIHQIGLNESLEGGEVIPGFSYPLRRLFRD